MAVTKANPIGAPAITTPRALDLRLLQQAIDNIRERFQKDEVEIGALRALIEGVTTGKAIEQLTAAVAKLQKQVAVLSSSTDTTLADLLAAGNGVVVVRDGQLVLRRVLSGSAGIFVSNPDGHDGNIIISVSDPLASSSPPQEGWTEWGGGEGDVMLEAL